MSKSNGFSLIETLIASGIVFMIVTTFVPITAQLYKERNILSDRRIFSSYLHDELQPFLWSDDQATLPQTYQAQVDSTTLKLTFLSEEQFIKGCVEWNNVKNNKEEICLFGYEQK